MENKEIKNRVRAFRKKYSLSKVDYKSIKNVLEKSGYSLIEFNNVYNDKNVTSLIDALHLTEFVRSSKCFTYADNNYRLIFVHEDLTEAEKLLVLSHEAAHIFLGHMSQRPVLGTAVQEEHQANEFSHYLLYENVTYCFGSFISKHKVLLISLLLLLAAIIAGSVIAFVGLNSGDKAGADTETDQVRNDETGDSVQQQTGADENIEYYGDYYITNTGSKYHKEQCKRIKDKTTKKRMTVEDFDSGKYEPCDICLPEDD